MKTILIIMGRYLPGYKDGGPVRSIKNLVDILGDKYHFRIITTDRDHGDTKSYDNIKLNEWNQVGNAMVYYVNPGGFHASILKRYSNEADLVYVCGCFNDYARTLLLLNRFGKIKPKIIIAAMGLFSPGAFAIKHTKKNVYIKIFKILGLFKNIDWSLTSHMEVSDTQMIIGKSIKYFIACDLPRIIEINNKKYDKETGKLKVVFLSRISPKKNLQYAVEILSKVKGDIEFSIYGNIEIANYWEQCLRLLQKLPQNIKWSYNGMATPDEVIDIFIKNDIFLFPTLGENYGHVIFEAMSAGCVPVVSNNTPWSDALEKGLGAAISLEHPDIFVKTIENYVAMDSKSMKSQSLKVYEFAKNYAVKPELADAYRQIFETLGRNRS